MKELNYAYQLQGFKYNVFSATTDRLTWGVVFKPLTITQSKVKQKYVEDDLKTLEIDYTVYRTCFIGNENKGFLIYMKFEEAERFVERYAKSSSANFAEQTRDLLLIQNMKNSLNVCYANSILQEYTECTKVWHVEDCKYHWPKLYCDYIPEQIHFTSEKQMVLFSVHPICDEYIANSLSCMIAKDMQKLGFAISKDYCIIADSTDDYAYAIQVFRSELAQILIRCSMSDEHEAKKICQSIEDLFIAKSSNEGADNDE